MSIKIKPIFLIFLGLAFFSLQFVHAQVVEKEYTKIEEALKDPDKVIRLNLENQKNHDYFKDLSKFKNLQYLSLRNTNLDTVPEEILTLKNLRTLDIGNNGFSLLPKKFSSLKNLQELYLDKDKNLKLFEDIEILSRLRNLKILNLDNNEKLYLNDNNLKTLPTELKWLKNLKYLDVHHNPITVPLGIIKVNHGGLKINF